MTLILSYVCPGYVLQVSDRLLTTVESPPRRYDDASNKSIVWAGRDAVVTMSYTGIAYIKGIPADQWIAEQLHGRPLPRPIALYTAAPWSYPCLDLGLGLERLRNALEGVCEKSVEWSRFEVVVAGWQDLFKHGRKPPRIACALIAKRDDGLFRINRVHRHWQWEAWRKGRFSIFRNPLVTDPLRGIEWLPGQLKAVESQDWPSHAELVQKLLVEAIRSEASRSEVIGTDVMSVFLPHPDIGPGWIRFLRGNSLSGQRARSERLAWSPWIVGCNMLSPPAAIYGGPFTYSLGGYPVIAHSPQPPGDDDLLFAFQIPPRKRPP